MSVRPLMATELTGRPLPEPPPRLLQQSPEPVTLSCFHGHEFETRATPGSRARCPSCRMAGRETRVRVPGGTPLSMRGKKNKAKRRVYRKAALRAEHEAALPLTDAQRELIAAARENLREISERAARAKRAGNLDMHAGLQGKREELSALLERLLAQAEDRAETRADWLMAARPRGR